MCITCVFLRRQHQQSQNTYLQSGKCGPNFGTCQSTQLPREVQQNQSCVLLSLQTRFMFKH